MRVSWRSRALVTIAAIGIVAAACSSGSGSSAGTSAGASAAPSTAATPAASTAASPAASAGGLKGNGETINIAVNPWVGYESNAAVIGYLLENQLNYKVEFKNLTEQVSWEGFQSGDVDAVVENWGHDDLVKTYITEKKVAEDAGQTGIKGVIGWFVPPWMAAQYPDISDWNNLNKYADLFKTSESGGKGQLLDGDPSYVTNDAALVKNLNLNFTVVVGGSESALIESFRKAEQNKTPLLAYFYDPQWFNNEMKLVRVNLPPYTAGCDAVAEAVACDYPLYNLNKIMATSLNTRAPAAAQFIKNFVWTAEDQNTVSNDIVNNNMKSADAAKKWVEANEAKWKAWLP
jgi:glycine betaine/proline transport system substrate-binding protein